MTITKDKVVSIHYTLTDDENNVIDSSHERNQPLKYLHGHNNLIPGMEEGLDGQEKDDELKLTILPEKGYGFFDEALVQVVPVSQFGEGGVKVGMRFQAQTEQGPVVVRVTKVDGNDVTVDANHELAGKTLYFDVKVLEVRDADTTEIAHGHVH